MRDSDPRHFEIPSPPGVSGDRCHTPPLTTRPDHNDVVHPYLAELRALDLPDGDWAIFGSGPLLVRGWIEDVGDIDVIARGAALDRAKAIGVEEDHGDYVAWRWGEGVTVGGNWRYGSFSVARLIDTAEMIEGFPCVLLEYVVAYKELAARPKDREHLRVIELHAE